MLKGASEVALTAGRVLEGSGGGAAGLGKLAKREQFVISLLDVAEIFKIN